MRPYKKFVLFCRSRRDRGRRLSRDQRGAGPRPRWRARRRGRRRFLLAVLRPLLLRRPVVRLPVPVSDAAVRLRLPPLRARGVGAPRGEAEGSRGLRRRLLRGRRRRLRRHVPAAARRAGRARDRAVARRLPHGAAEGVSDAGQHVPREVSDGAARVRPGARAEAAADRSAAGRQPAAHAAAAADAAADGTRTDDAPHAAAAAARRSARS